MENVTADQAGFAEHDGDDRQTLSASIFSDDEKADIFGADAFSADAATSGLPAEAETVATEVVVPDIGVDAKPVIASPQPAVDADWVLARLAEQAEADIADLYDDNGDLLPVKDWPAVWRTGLVSDVEITAVYEGRGDERKLVGHVKKLKLVDRTRRLEMIGKHVRVNAFQDVVKLRGLKSLADRLERARKRDAEADP
ncbi:terminase small subunit [Rhizobium sp. CG4]|uniref:terminase small subunit n=1 Tax=Rhizobium sp. CG4 TaxID=2726075 RepID=UPI0020334662|nr:terminase small subunit [Rhizobium sp. CG4]MCM2454759.1 terminase small subunit [Rhizobium sp. CG4]